MFAFPATAPAPTPKTVEARIHAIGAQPTVRELWNRPKEWDAVMAAIETGDAAWLKVATDLKPGSDAGSSESLAIVVSRSIQHNPRAFLLIAFPSFGVAVCRDLTIEGTKEQHDNFQRKTEKALESVGNDDTRKNRDACLVELRK
jgi:hypothetical protein